MSYGYGRGSGGRGGDRWDTERFEIERERSRIVSPPRDRFEERESHAGRSGGLGRPRERSAEEIFEHRGGRGFEEDRYERREYYDDEPRFERERPIGRDRGQSITIEKEREYYEPRRAPARPGFLRRQSSLDTFDRRPTGQLTRFEREEYGPPARYREEARLPPLTPIPLPRTRGIPPARRYVERDYEEIRVAEPEYYGDEEYRGIPERVREREIIRRRRRSRSQSRGSTRASQSVRSTSSSSGVSERSGTTSRTTKSEFPKKGKTRMPARLVSKKAIIDLGYSFEEDGDVVIIQKALGRENIDEVIKLSEDYKSSETAQEVETTLTTYLVGPEAEMSGARSESGHTIYEEHRTQEVFTVPQAPLPSFIPPPPVQEVITDTKIVETTSSPYQHHAKPLIIEARGPPQSDFIQTKHTTFVEHSDPMPVGPLALALPAERSTRSTSSIRQEIRALEAEKEALRAEKRANRELRKADRIRHSARASESDLVLYERDVYETPHEEVTLVRREIIEPEGGVKITKDRKVSGAQAKAIRTMLKTLT